MLSSALCRQLNVTFQKGNKALIFFLSILEELYKDNAVKVCAYCVFITDHFFQNTFSFLKGYAVKN